MGFMKLCLCLLLMVVAAAPPYSYAAPDYAFFGGYAPAQLTEDGRRLLFQYGYDRTNKMYRRRYLSYEALTFNNIPCGRRGSSYYDCRKRRRINPYRRGCTAITGCARFTD
ncbi:protein RALF-like 31 [Cucurbita moschata]|uniref:Protein RALF-like 31 n=2 Tax=Cucurbita TaxID=3660 RepID=A0A6J1EBL1_CUCMO